MPNGNDQVIEALADGAVMMGLPRALATEQVRNNKHQQKQTCYWTIKANKLGTKTKCKSNKQSRSLANEQVTNNKHKQKNKLASEQ